MTMVFNVKDRFMLDKLQPIDKVEFEVVNDGANSQCPSSKSFADRLCAAPLRGGRRADACCTQDIHVAGLRLAPARSRSALSCMAPCLLRRRNAS